MVTDKVDQNAQHVGEEIASSKTRVSSSISADKLASCRKLTFLSPSGCWTKETFSFPKAYDWQVWAHVYHSLSYLLSSLLVSLPPPALTITKNFETITVSIVRQVKVASTMNLPDSEFSLRQTQVNGNVLRLQDVKEEEENGMKPLSNLAYGCHCCVAQKMELRGRVGERVK
ncbi:hypothetical protein V8G54_016643 [Vigna mungo]|uniref:Uncharacterized protein n=1 Tax=Vigna mungo TaxID=3915 RepID=A0AAQ3NPF6_VIGMU